MIWNSWSDFFAMGGYAFYVWGSALVFAGCIAVELTAVRLRRKAIRDMLFLRNAVLEQHEEQGGTTARDHT